MADEVDAIMVFNYWFKVRLQLIIKNVGKLKLLLLALTHNYLCRRYEPSTLTIFSVIKHKQHFIHI